MVTAQAGATVLALVLTAVGPGTGRRPSVRRPPRSAARVRSRLCCRRRARSAHTRRFRGRGGLDRPPGTRPARPCRRHRTPLRQRRLHESAAASSRCSAARRPPSATRIPSMPGGRRARLPRPHRFRCPGGWRPHPGCGRPPAQPVQHRHPEVVAVHGGVIGDLGQNRSGRAATRPSARSSGRGASGAVHHGSVAVYRSSSEVMTPTCWGDSCTTCSSAPPTVSTRSRSGRRNHARSSCVRHGSPGQRAVKRNVDQRHGDERASAAMSEAEGDATSAVFPTSPLKTSRVLDAVGPMASGRRQARPPPADRSPCGTVA